MLNKILYVIDINDSKNYQYNIVEDTVIYHFSINSSSKVNINLLTEGVNLYYYYSNINYDNNSFKIDINHKNSKTNSYIINHGVNVFDKKLDYFVEGIVPKKSIDCVCNQDNQIINMNNGKSRICPNLIIDEYTTSASHGAYIGSFSKDKIFYLLSRGISIEEVNRLLLNGFLLSMDSIDISRVDDFIKEINKI